jgi:hypothetical protein
MIATIEELTILLANLNIDATAMSAIVNASATTEDYGLSPGYVTSRLGAEIMTAQKALSELGVEIISIKQDGSDVLSTASIDFVGLAVADVAGVATVTYSAPTFSLDDITDVDLTGIGPGTDGYAIVWNDTTSMFVLAVLSAGSSSYDLRFGFLTSPTSSEVIDTVLVGRGITFPADFAGSLGATATPPASTFLISVTDDAVEIGTISIDVSGVYTFATTDGVEKIVAVGSVLSLVAPASADASIAGANMTILGLET